MKTKNLIKLSRFVVLVFILINNVITTSLAVTETTVDAADAAVIADSCYYDSYKYGESWGGCVKDAVIVIVMPRVLEGITKEAVSKVIAYFKYLDETYPAFTKTLGEFLEGIKINWWDDVITNGAKSINDISLSDGGKYIKKYPGNPSSTSSEIISFENFYRRGARFLKGENGPSAIRYVDNGVGGKPVDFLGEMNGKKVAVSVTRVFRSIDNAKEPVLTKALAKRDIQGAIDALSNRLPTAIDKWDEGVVHVFVKQSDKSLVESAITEVNLGQNKIVVTVVEDNSFIWS